VNVRYWIQPGTAASVSHDGGPFEPHTTARDLFFEQPAEETAEDFVFADGGWRLRVAKALVWRYEWDGTGGRNRRCG
jgi:hypothetical protein